MIWNQYLDLRINRGGRPRIGVAAELFGHDGKREAPEAGIAAAAAASSAGTYDNVFDGMRGGGQPSSWGRAPEFFPEQNSFGRPQPQPQPQGLPWDPRQMFLQGGGMPLPVREKNVMHHGAVLNGVDMKGHVDSAHDQMIGAERNEGDAHLRHSQSEADTKRAKQQYAQRSRVRKLQYIAELERRVQALQTQGIEVSAEMDFLGQQNIMLDLENKSLKQRLESLSQEFQTPETSRFPCSPSVGWRRLPSFLSPPPAPPTGVGGGGGYVRCTVA